MIEERENDTTQEDEEFNNLILQSHANELINKHYSAHFGHQDLLPEKPKELFKSLMVSSAIVTTTAQIDVVLSFSKHQSNSMVDGTLEYLKALLDELESRL